MVTLAIAKTIRLASLLAVAALWPALAIADCECRANGQKFAEGQVACLKLPAGETLARCSKVLSNTSWQILGKGCPSSQLHLPMITTPAVGLLSPETSFQPVETETVGKQG